MRDHAEALRLIEKAVLALQGYYPPGRPPFYALGKLHEEFRRARRTIPPAEKAQSPDRP